MAQTYIVNQGEYLSLIAKKFGFADWRTIYEHPRNAQFKKRRPNPDVIFPGDRLYIPDKECKKHSCATGRRHRFTVKAPPRNLLRIVLKDQDGRPLANTHYTLKVAKRIFQNRTSHEGLLQQEIPLGEETGELSVKELGITWSLQIGHLDPVEEVVEDHAIITGLQARLNNLGFSCGEVDGVLGPRTRAAVKEFQHRLLKRDDPDGQPDQETREVLLAQHGC